LFWTKKHGISLKQIHKNIFKNYQNILELIIFIEASNEYYEQNKFR
jgi:hypothetical protein